MAAHEAMVLRNEARLSSSDGCLAVTSQYILVTHELLELVGETLAFCLLIFVS